ncbi:putative vesicle associated protein [Operophtera brumata]|uniref:Putative vesicle associated protein n=1 Tax=Operophtera brumata TaxID=104452 RepID=A0A0L7LAP0_OPEBR|nr:putative vesicle associated protein [Operophtera brumata]
MKLKELKRTVNVCWSPAEHHPVTLAAGSSAQQVDATFNSSSYLELYSLNLEDPGQDLELKSSLQTEHKFQKIVWSGANVIVGGCDGGLLQFYSVDKLLSNATKTFPGNVSALDINPYQKNLLASGASDSEIFIWDLNNTSQPMAPGNRSQPADHSRTRWRSLAWHPSVATQVCIASEEDQVPGHHKGVMSLSWSQQDPDLLLSAGKDGRVLCWNPNDTRPVRSLTNVLTRNVTSPLVTLEGHHKGVMSLSWSQQEPDLLLLAGKDGRGGALLAELSQQAQWVFDVSWSPRNPALFATSSFEQQLSVHSLFGGSRAESSPQSQSNIMESFGGADSFSQLPAVPRASVSSAPDSCQLPSAPAWLKRPSAAKFAFGGKLVTFDRCPQEAGSQKQVYISQVVSEPEIVEKAADLDGVLGSVLSHEPDATERLADAGTPPRTSTSATRGFKQDDIPSKFKSQNVGDVTQPDTAALSRGESTETEAELSTDTSTDLSDAQTLIERKLASIELEPTVTDVVIPNGEDATSVICRALVCGNLEEAVELCLDAKRISDALVIASLGSQELVYKVQKYHLKLTATDPVSLITSSVLQSRWDTLVSSAAPSSWKHTLAAILTHCEGEALAHYCGRRQAGDGAERVRKPASVAGLPRQRAQHAGGRGITSRSKYKVDPSVQSSPHYNNYSFNNNPVTSQPSYGYNSPIPDQYHNSSVNNFAPINPANPGLNHLNPLNPGLNQPHPGLNPLNPGLNHPNPGVNPLNPGVNPAVNGSYYTPQQAVEAMPNKPAAPGWNDPPMPSSKPKHIIGTDDMCATHAGTRRWGHIIDHRRGLEVPRVKLTSNACHFIYEYPEIAVVEAPAAPEPPAPVQKGPLPEQHTVLQSVFDSIRAECSERAANPLSETALLSLHTCVQCVQSRDYSSALEVCTSLATGADFAAAASFLPGLKGLLQLAHQLQVYQRRVMHHEHTTFFIQQSPIKAPLTNVIVI